MLWRILSIANIFIGFCGIALVAYGGIKDWKGHAYEPIERTASWIASIGTFLSLAILAASIYLPPGYEHPPRPESISITAPIVLIASLAAIIITILRSGNISPHIVNGAGLLGICGAIFRVLPV